MTSTPSVTVDSITVLRNGIFLVASQEIICNSGRQQTKSLTKILDENALEYLASRMSQGQVIDIMTYNSYSLQYYSFRIIGI